MHFFDDGKILIIGRQVLTNLGSLIDLLGLDTFGNTVIIELKRGKTPRETVAQLLEYASFNKTSKLVIVAQDISLPIRQTALYLRKKGIDLYCMEF